MNLRKLSPYFTRAGIPAALCAVAGVLVTAFAAIRILDRLWAHLGLELLRPPVFGAVVVPVAGVALFAVCTITLRRISPSRSEASR
ncbi:hypothetical protein [Streptomyces avermitilis]|uniref:hypothetical protein n=1 Tax=Streptomyces avermitilis TaxID=33903 RepID=UPI0033BD9819